MHTDYINIFDISICYYHPALLFLMKQNGNAEAITVSGKKDVKKESRYG